MKSMSVFTWLRLLWRGFFTDKYQIYQLKRRKWKLFMSDRQMLISSGIDGKYGIVLQDKILFELVMSRYVKVPQNFALIRDGKLLWLDSHPVEGRDLIGLVKQQEKVILKPRGKGGGEGVHLLEFREGSFWYDFQPVDEETLIEILFKSEDVIIMEYIRQGQFANKLYPKTVNTMRILTMLDPESQTLFIGAAILRVGCARSIPRDNVSSGGMFCDIDLKTGRLSKAATDFFMDKPFRWLDRHPETDVIFEEQVVPDWNDKCKEIVDLAGKFPMIPYIAWDVAILEQGICVIEGNQFPEVSVFQVYRPLLEDHRIRKFFEHHKVL
ncbi:hypothetical protein AC481_00780 [miscellaneous Crenarchaeota group archaeon SMTZ-80]|nr:MAG: hypothetical protein AC481_00780 [miscellaneous Crenarchaeota group archaeon SMTZ-80]